MRQQNIWIELKLQAFSINQVNLTLDNFVELLLELAWLELAPLCIIKSFLIAWKNRKLMFWGYYYNFWLCHVSKE